MSLKRWLQWFVMGALSAVLCLAAFVPPGFASGGEFVVSTTNDSGDGSLRQAILDANANPGRDRIVFDIQSSPSVGGLYSILLTELLPPVTDPVEIDGISQPGYSLQSGPVVEISGSQLEKSCSGVESGRYRDHPGLDVVHNSLGDASGTTIMGLRVSQFCQAISVTASLEGLQQSCLGAAATDLRISNITVRDNLVEGNLDGNGALDLCFAQNSTIESNEFYNNGDHMELTRSQHVVVEGNVGTAAQDAIELVRSQHIAVKNNRFSNNRRGGIVLVFEASHNEVLDNEITNMAAMGLTLSNDNVAKGNTITGSGWFGIEIRGGSGNVVSDNVVKNNGLGGIAVNAGTLNGLDDCPTFDEQGNPDPTEACAVKFTVQNPNVQGDAFRNLIVNNEVVANHGPGIVVGGSFEDLGGRERSAAYNTLSGNIIYANDGLGIDLSDETQNAFFIVEEPLAGVFGQIVLAQADGVTPNDSGILANGSQNYPLLTSAWATPGQLVVKGTLNTPNPRAARIEFFANPAPTPGGDPSGHGEGAVFLGTGRPSSQGKFTATLPSVPAGTLITATATGTDGSTSEFAEDIEAQFSPGP